MIRTIQQKQKKKTPIAPSRKDRIEIARRIANSKDGMTQIKYMQRDLLKSPIVKGSVEETYANIGRQDYIKEQLKLIEDEERYDRIKIYEP